MDTVYTRYDSIGRKIRMTKHLLRNEWYIYVGAKLRCVTDNIGDAYRFYNHVV